MFANWEKQVKTWKVGRSVLLTAKKNGAFQKKHNTLKTI